MLNNIRKYDIRHGMELGSWQTNIVYNFLLENLNIESYKCGTNGVVSYIKGVNDSGFGYSIEIENRDWSASIVRVSYNDKEYVKSYSSIQEFKQVMDNIDL